MPNNKSAFSASESTIVTSNADWDAGTKTSNVVVSSDALTLSSSSYDFCANLANIYVDDYELFGPKENACDGDGGTYWNITGPDTGTHYWMYDASSDPLYIGSVKLSAYGGAGSLSGPDPVRLEYSDNGSDWTTLSIVNMGADNWNNPIVIDPPVLASYFRYVGYIIQGDGTNPNEFGLSEIEVSPASSGVHTSSSTQIAGSADLESWDSFTTTETDHNQNGGNAATTIVYQFRSGDGTAGDGGWSAWTASQDYSGSSFDLSSLSADSSHQYLQVKTTLSTTNSSYTPTLSDYTVNYTTADAPTCSDEIQNGDETGVDCGGSCDACPTCSDEIQNGDETGVDCGGSCDACPTCSDEIQNGDETGVDCGGSCDACPVPPACDDGVQNGDETGVDCGGSCGACPTCSDGIQNGDEEDIDCGGSCDACPTCSDEIQNGDETGVDCGGSCDACPVDPTCSDGIKNQDETGIDCGGVCPACSSPTAESCDDDIQNQDETGVDCGGSCDACPVTTNPDPVCPLTQTYLCDKTLCKNSISIIKPVVDSQYNIGDNLEISWLNNSSAVSLVDGWNIRYRLSISYDNGATYNTISNGIKDINFSNQTAWQEIFNNSNWQSKIKANTYNFVLPSNPNIATNQAKVKVTMYRIQSNPFGCSGGLTMISPQFTINSSAAQTQCSTERFVFTSPINIVSAEGNENINAPQDAQGNNMVWQYYYYLNTREISNWPNNSLKIILKDLNLNSKVVSNDLSLSPSDIGNINNDGYVIISNKYPNPINFLVNYYDQDCGKTISLKFVASSINEAGKLDIRIPNGGEFWLLGKEKSIEWSNTYKQSVIDQVTLELSLDGGKTWRWDLASNKELYQNDASDNTPFFIKVDTLSHENSYIWKIPIEELLLTKQARVKITAYDRDGKFISSDISDNNFQISSSTLAALLDKISNNVNVINIYTAIAALLAAALAAVVPGLQNLSSIASFREFIYGIILAGRKKKNKWGVVYDAYNSTPIPYTIIMLHDAATQRLIETTTTDINGLYGFIAKKGRYFIRVKKEGYESSSANIMSRQELAYNNNYFGGEIVINEEEQLMSANIPLTLTFSFDKIVKRVNFFTAFYKALLILNWPLILVGTFVSITALYYYPNAINIIIMILYIPIWIIQFSSIGGKKAFGLVLEAAMEKPIDLALVRLFDSQTNRLVHTVASDMKGHYSVLVKNGKYQIRCQKSGFIMDKPINKEITKGLAALSDTIKMRTENGNIPASSISDNTAVNNANINLDLSNIQN